MMQDKPLSVAYIDDDTDDWFLFETALAAACAPCALTLLDNSEHAMDRLQKSIKDFHLIFLDLNMPIRSGLDVLRSIQDSIGQLHPIIIILSTSASTVNIEATYKLGATRYVQKPTDFEAFVRLLTHIIAEAPTLRRPASINEFVIKD